MWFGHEVLKGLNYRYDTAKDLLSMLHNELTLIDEIWLDPIFAGPTNPQGSERKNRSEQGKKRWLQKNKNIKKII